MSGIWSRLGFSIASWVVSISATVGTLFVPWAGFEVIRVTDEELRRLLRKRAP